MSRPMQFPKRGRWLLLLILAFALGPFLIILRRRCGSAGP